MAGDDQYVTRLDFMIRNQILCLKQALDFTDKVIVNLMKATSDHNQELRVPLDSYLQDLIRTQDCLKKDLAGVCKSIIALDDTKECNVAELDSSNNHNSENCKTVCEEDKKENGSDRTQYGYARGWLIQKINLEPEFDPHFESFNEGKENGKDDRREVEKETCADRWQYEYARRLLIQNLKLGPGFYPGYESSNEGIETKTEIETETDDQENDDETVLSKRVEGFESQLYFRLPALFVLMQKAGGMEEMEEDAKFLEDFHWFLKWLSSGAENGLMDRVVVMLSIARKQLEEAIKKSEKNNAAIGGEPSTDITEEASRKKGLTGILLNQILEDIQHVAYLIKGCDNLGLFMSANKFVRQCEEEQKVIKSRMKELEEDLGAELVSPFAIRKGFTCV